MNKSEPALAAAEGIKWEVAKAEALVGVAQALAGVGEQAQARQVLAQALAAAEGIRDREDKAEGLHDVAQALAGITTPGDQAAVSLLHQALRHARTQGRDSAWAHIRAFAPVLAALGGPIIAQTWQRIQAVERLAALPLSSMEVAIHDGEHNGHHERPPRRGQSDAEGGPR